MFAAGGTGAAAAEEAADEGGSEEHDASNEDAKALLKARRNLSGASAQLSCGAQLGNTSCNAQSMADRKLQHQKGGAEHNHTWS